MTRPTTESRHRVIDSVRRVRARFGLVLALTLVSQCLSALSTLVLPTLGLDVADVYAIGTQVGLASLTGVTIGVVYNLAIGRPGFSAWRPWALAAALFSVAICLGQFFVLTTRGSIRAGWGETLAVFVSFGVGGACLAVAGVRAVQEACLGRPRRLAGITIGPNAALLASVALVAILHTRGPVAIAVPAVVWAMAGCASLLAAASRGDLATSAPTVPRDLETGRRVHAAALIVGVVTSSVLPPVVIGAVAGLGSGVPYALYLTSKLGNSAVALGVNSLLLVRYTWYSGGLRSTRLIEALTAVGTAAAVVAAAGADFPASVTFVVCGVGWLCLVVGSAIAVRELNARAMGSVLLAKVIVDVVLATCAALFLVRNPSVPGFFACFMVSAGVTITAGGIGLHKLRLSLLGSAGVLAAFGLLIGAGQ